MNMFMSIVVKMITSEMAKQLIGLAIKKLVEHKKDGVTKEVIEAVLDGAVKSRENNLTLSDVAPILSVLK